MTSTSRILVVYLVLVLAATAVAIKCWKCGQYSDGVGSITPCNNRSATKLEECSSNARYCIKYVSELTTVRDCVPTCSEKEWWGARTFCCDTDECNSAYTIQSVAMLIFVPLILIATVAH